MKTDINELVGKIHYQKLNYNRKTFYLKIFISFCTQELIFFFLIFSTYVLYSNLVYKHNLVMRNSYDERSYS